MATGIDGYSLRDAKCLAALAAYDNGHRFNRRRCPVGHDNSRICHYYQRARGDKWRGIAGELVLLLRHNQGSPARAREAFRATLAKYDAAVKEGKEGDGQ